MRAVLLFLALVLALAGCGESESEKAAKEAIRAASQADFSQGVDAAGLAKSLRLCASIQSRDCIEVEAKAQAVADAVASCSGNDSALCRAVSNTASLRQFKGGAAAVLPDHPFYWSLGNELLDAQASTFGFRGEMWGRWHATWRGWLLAALAGVVSLVAGWLWIDWRQAEADERAQADAARKAQEARQRAAQEHAKAEATRKAKEAAREAAEAQARAEATRRAEIAAKAAAEAKAKAEAKAQEEAQQVKDATAAALAAAFGKPKR